MRVSESGSMRGTDVVDDHPAQRRTGQPGECHADQAAHRRAEPVDRFDVEPCNQRHHVGHVLRNRIEPRIGQPVGPATPGDIGTHDAIRIGQRGGKPVEIAPGAGQSMHTDQHARIGGIPHSV